MDIYISVLRFIIYSVIGFYIFKLIEKITKRKSPKFCLGIISPFYGFFSLACTIDYHFEIFSLFTLGIIFSFILQIITGMIYDFSFKINYILFGVLNIINYYFFEPIINAALNFSSNFSIITLTLISSLIFLLDISVSCRRNI